MIKPLEKVVQGLFPNFSSRNNPRVAFGLGGGSEKGYSHVGAFEFFEEAGIWASVIYGKSVGAMVAATEDALEGKYLRDHSAFGGKLPAQELQNTLSRHGKLLRKLRPFEMLSRGGLKDPSKIALLLNEIVGNAQFKPNSRLRVVAYDKGGNREVVYGEDLFGPVVDGVMASIAVPGIIESPEGKLYLGDGGINGKIPLNNLFLHPYDLRVIIYLGYFDRFSDYQMPELLERANHMSKAELLRKALRIADAKIQYTMEQMRLCVSNLQRRLFESELSGFTRMSFKHVVEGRYKGLIVVLPKHAYVDLNGNADMGALFKAGYSAAQEAFLRYVRHHPDHIKYIIEHNPVRHAQRTIP